MDFFRKLNILDYKGEFFPLTSDIPEDIIELYEEFFYTKAEEILGRDAWRYESVETLFTVENYLPDLHKKEIPNGSWIRVKTDEGYNIYWATPSQYSFSVEKTQRQMKSLKSKPQTSATLSKMLKLNDELLLAQFAMIFPIKPYFVKALRTKTQYVYLLPHEYEIVEDIQLYVNAIVKDKKQKAVKYQTLFTSKDEDVIFYLRSRGISHEAAVFMSHLKNCYFKIDTQRLFSEAIQLVEN